MIIVHYIGVGVLIFVLGMFAGYILGDEEMKSLDRPRIHKSRWCKKDGDK